MTVGLFRAISTEIQIILLTTAASIAIIAVPKPLKLSSVERYLVAASVVLFIYTYTLSPFVGRSIVQAFYFFSTVVLYLACKKALELEKDNTFNYMRSALLAFVTLHALALVVLYTNSPVRATGLMEDYSQAALLILFAFIISYPDLKSKPHFTTLTLVLFLGFFCTFSRSVNFLLILTIAALFGFEWRHGNIKHILKPTLIIIGCLGFAYGYPALTDNETVDRGGLRDIGSLNSRTLYWESAWDAIKQKPIVGHGLGNFEWTGIKEIRPFKAIHHVHNDYLQVWHDLGVFWLLLLVVSIAILLFKTTPKQVFTPPDRRLTLEVEQRYAGWLALICMVLYMTINFALYSIPLLTALVLCCLNLRCDRRD